MTGTYLEGFKLKKKYPNFMSNSVHGLPFETILITVKCNIIL